METAVMGAASAASKAVPIAVQVCSHRSVQGNKLLQLSAIIRQSEYTLTIVGAHCEDSPEDTDSRPLAGLLTKLKEAKALKLEAEKAREGESGAMEACQWMAGLYAEKIQTMINDCREEIKLLLEIDSRQRVKKGEKVEDLHRRHMESLPAIPLPLPLMGDVVVVQKGDGIAVGCVVDVDPKDELLKYKVEFLDGVCDWFPGEAVSLQLMLSESLVGDHLPLEIFFDDLLKSIEADTSKRNDLRQALAVFNAKGIKVYGDLVRAKGLNSFAELREVGLTKSAEKLITEYMCERCQLSEDSLKAAILACDYVFVVIGERGDGKTTLVNGLRDKEKTIDGMTGKNVRGVTKTISAFRGQIHDSKSGTMHNVLYLDFPGYGDIDFPPTAWIAKFQTLLAPILISKKRDAKHDGILDGILVLTAIPKCAFNASLQVMKKIMSLGFLSEENWQSVIFVGTMKDRCEDEDAIMEFEEGAVALMFEECRITNKLFCCVSKFDYAPVKCKIAELINLKRLAAGSVSRSATKDADAGSVSRSATKDADVDAKRYEGRGWQQAQYLPAPRPENIAKIPSRLPPVEETVQGVFRYVGSTEEEKTQFTKDLGAQIEINQFFLGTPSLPSFSWADWISWKQVKRTAWISMRGAFVATELVLFTVCTLGIGTAYWKIKYGTVTPYKVYKEDAGEQWQYCNKYAVD